MSDADRLQRSRIRMLFPALGLGLFVLVAALVSVVAGPDEREQAELFADVRTVTLAPAVGDQLPRLSEDELRQLQEALVPPALDRYDPVEVRPVLLVERREPGPLCAFARRLQSSDGVLAQLGRDLARTACDEG